MEHVGSKIEFIFVRDLTISQISNITSATDFYMLDLHVFFPQRISQISGFGRSTAFPSEGTRRSSHDLRRQGRQAAVRAPKRDVCWFIIP